MELVVTVLVVTALLTVAGDPVTHLAEARQGFEVDVDQVIKLLPLLALHRKLGLQIPQSAEAEPADSPGEGGEGYLQQPGDVSQMQALMPYSYGVL